MFKNLIAGTNVVSAFFQAYPMWVRILAAAWAVFTIILLLSLLFFRVSEKEQSRAPMRPEKTPLYAKTKQRIEDFYVDIERNKLTPWAFLRTGKMQEVKDYYGKSIWYQGDGIGFEGSPSLVFWEGFIEPFLEHGILDTLEQVAAEANKSNLDPEPCIAEAAGFLSGCISRVYYRMAEIDQRLRGKGFPENVKRRDVSHRIQDMTDYLYEQQKAFVEIAKSKADRAPEERFYHTNTFKFVVIPILAIVATLIVGVPAWISVFHKTGDASTQTTNIFANVSKQGIILQSNNFPWKIEKSEDEDGNTLYVILDRGGDATAISVIPNYPEYTIYQACDGMAIKYTCAEEEIPDFTIKVRY
jgi:hypothetical protein